MTTNGMDTVDGFLGPRLGLRSSRVTSNAAYEDQDEREHLIPSDDNNYRNEFRKSQGRSWKAKREDSDEDYYNYGKNENGSAIQLQRIRGKTQPTCKYLLYDRVRKPLLENENAPFFKRNLISLNFSDF